jgi:hypothetical protein
MALHSRRPKGLEAGVTFLSAGRFLPLALALACTSASKDDPEPVPEPGALQAGLSSARIPAPLGIGTAGYGAFGADANPTPFAEIYPGTEHIWGHPDIEVLALSRGEGFEVVFVRIDAIGVFTQLRQAIVTEVSDRLGRDMDAALILGATHTHSAPGRLVNTGTDESSFFDLIADRFHAEFYERFVHTVADAVVAAFDDLQPARVGSTVTTQSTAHDDRRCEDGETYENGSLPLLVVERNERIDAVLMAYAVHPTGLGIDDRHLSADVSGAIEQVTEDGFDHPVQVMQFNAWGADMSPGNPDIEVRPTAERKSDYVRMQQIGQAISEAVQTAVPGLVFADDPVIDLAVHQIPINRELIGYDAQTFPYPYGGVYCGLGAGTCDPPTRQDNADQACVPFNESFPAPMQTLVTVGQVGDFHVVTFPGEPGTRLIEGLLDQIRAAHPAVEDILFLGYTQDYLGYSIEEEDWWFGGYESSGALWGPRQGEYLREQIVHRFGVWAGTEEPVDEPPPLVPFPYTIEAPYVVETAIEPATVAVEVPAEVNAVEAVLFVVNGEDPWLGAPVVELLDGSGAPVLRPGGSPVQGDDLDFDVSLTVEPDYEDSSGGIVREERRFAWQVRLAPRSPLLGGLDLTGGSYQIRVNVPRADGSITAVDSAVFSVVAPL